MRKPNCAAQSSPLQKGKHRRFSLQYPVDVKVHSADLIVELDAVSSNISIGGLLLETSFPIPQHTPVSFIVTVRSAQVVRPIQFVGEGKVVRVDPQAAQEVFAIAVECARPITRIDHYLEATGS
ncbi:MAG TPA: PilZ domain-containing protein [Terriglobales bacterium]|nr:PilZ domain-containing protein [Terriglobales bacterium]